MTYYKEVVKSEIELFLVNGVRFGCFSKEVDGYFYFKCDWAMSQGCFPSQFLRSLANRLDELNEEWDKEVKSICQKPS
jgi:hypothetical protein